MNLLKIGAKIIGLDAFTDPDKTKKMDWIKNNMKFVIVISIPVSVVLGVLVWLKPDATISLLTKIIYLIAN